jgi:hypothetical protein
LHCIDGQGQVMDYRCGEHRSWKAGPLAHIVHARVRAYVMDHNRSFQDSGMSDTATLPNRRNWRPFAIIAAVAGVLIAGTVALWAHYGTAVFYEMILAGIAMCL